VGLGQVLGSFAVNVAILHRLPSVSAVGRGAPAIGWRILVPIHHSRHHPVGSLFPATTPVACVAERRGRGLLGVIAGSGAGLVIARKSTALMAGYVDRAGALTAGVAQWNAAWVLGAGVGRQEKKAAGFLCPPD